MLFSLSGPWLRLIRTHMQKFTVSAKQGTKNQAKREASSELRYSDTLVIDPPGQKDTRPGLLSASPLRSEMSLAVKQLAASFFS
jgi:hypothetical protein